MIRVAAVDDDRMLLEGLRSWLADVPGLRLVATVGTVAELTAPADVVLLDLRLRDGTLPADNIRRLVADGNRVLVISTVPDRDQVIAAIRAGAGGYLTKDNDLATLVGALHAVAAGDTAYSPELAHALANDPAGPPLSAQERAVLVAYASGLTLTAAARRAGVSPHTAKAYLDRVKDKYRQAGRPTWTKLDLANRAREDGLL
ncbi:response regulator transcription factor [Longispora fulva]|uniref:DNA-binding NarL/FixJ family response regulator n=1 Tax=Longispora fulva TaxID=619741 RepID=A0A8J7KVN7_9ACTN|nr:response regulator transcription factor [Longispora fulva]MBG6135527.1 DNA-binding NarL/FixJ family response regulator [Longispora fulva]